MNLPNANMVIIFLTDRRVQSAQIILLVVLCAASISNRTEDNVFLQSSKHSPDLCSKNNVSPSDSIGCILETLHDPVRPPKSVQDPYACDFFNEFFNRAACFVEKETHLLVKQLINPKDVVLELGGRYGSTTCAVAVEQKNSGALIVVEPDPSVWSIHEFNKQTHNCASWSVFGVLGSEDMMVLELSEANEWLPGFTYNTKTSADTGANGVRVKHITWEQVETVTGLKVDTVILDCEGCWIDVVKENLEKFRNVKMIILENDHPDKEKTLEGFKLLESVGFTQDKRSPGKLDKIPSQFVFTKERW